MTYTRQIPQTRPTPQISKITPCSATSSSSPTVSTFHPLPPSPFSTSSSQYPQTICPAIPNPIPATRPAAAIHPTVCLALPAPFPAVPLITKLPPCPLPNCAQLELWILKHASLLSELQILVALALPKLCTLGLTVTPAPDGAMIVTAKLEPLPPCRSAVQAA